MKPYIKAILFLLLLTLLDFLLRQGFVFLIIPLPLPENLSSILVYSLFAVAAWFITQWFCKRDKIELGDLGISFDSKNRSDFYIGFLIGVGLWAIVSLIQAYTAGFSWELRPEISLFNVLYGLVFIFIADLGTELFTRGYPLTRFKDSFGAIPAIIIMTVFVGLKSYSPNMERELLLYAILIPALHTIFFSIIYFKTKRLGAAVGVHTGANFITISIFDLRVEQANQAIPAGIFQANTELESLSLVAIQLPWVFMAALFSIVVYFWWAKEKVPHKQV
ncbi:MAG: CPBP family intramembrane glutamic endopeptidase [Bacteroidia bacterium]|nr:CPBP family intramembrane glutamic endopeptidase [Bacteroidia bacterium]